MDSSKSSSSTGASSVYMITYYDISFSIMMSSLTLLMVTLISLTSHGILISWAEEFRVKEPSTSFAYQGIGLPRKTGTKPSLFLRKVNDLKGSYDEGMFP